MVAVLVEEAGLIRGDHVLDVDEGVFSSMDFKCL